MSRFLVIPANETAQSLVRTYITNPITKQDELKVKLDRTGAPMTRAVEAAENGCTGIEIFGSAWCLANNIDGLGICTEDSGQDTPAEVAAKIAFQIAAAEAADVQRKLLIVLANKALVTKADLDAVPPKVG